MQFPSPVSIQWLAGFLGAELIGNKDGQATGINEIHKVEKGDLVFVDHPKYYETCVRSEASFIIINKVVEVPPGKALLVVDQPFDAYLKIVRHFRPFEPATGMISSSAVVGKDTYIYPNAFIGHHVTIGQHCMIHPNVTILDHCVIGDHVIIQAGTVIGSDAFYYNGKKDREVWYRKMESCGRVVIGDYVEIGAGCAIDRGVTHDTVIGAGSKLDNLIHIGHDTVTGKNCLFAGQVGIAGAVEIGNGRYSLGSGRRQQDPYDRGQCSCLCAKRRGGFPGRWKGLFWQSRGRGEDKNEGISLGQTNPGAMEYVQKIR